MGPQKCYHKLRHSSRYATRCNVLLMGEQPTTFPLEEVQALRAERAVLMARVGRLTNGLVIGGIFTTVAMALSVWSLSSNSSSSEERTPKSLKEDLAKTKEEQAKVRIETKENALSNLKEVRKLKIDSNLQRSSSAGSGSTIGKIYTPSASFDKSREDSISPASRHSGKLEVHVVDVSQGDAIFIRCPEESHELLIDAGDTRYPGSRKNFQTFMRASQARSNTLEVVVNSHPHADHLGNIAWVLKRYSTGLYVNSGEDYDNRPYRWVDEILQSTAFSFVEVKDLSVAVYDIDFCPVHYVPA